MAWRLTSHTGAHVPDTGACCRLEGPHVAPEGVGLPALRSECKGGSAQANRCQCNEHTRHESNFFWLSSLGRNDSDRRASLPLMQSSRWEQPSVGEREGH